MKITGTSPPMQLEHVESVELRHLDVEHQQVGLQLRGRLDRLEAVRAFRHDLDVRVLCQPLAKDPARQLLVIDDDHTKTARVRFAHAVGAVTES